MSLEMLDEVFFYYRKLWEEADDPQRKAYFSDRMKLVKELMQIMAIGMELFESKQGNRLI